MEMFRRTYAEINLDHLAHNIQLIQKSFPQVEFICPMVKANAYGHGDVQVARFIEKLGVKHVGVCLIEEGMLLRNFGVKAEILVFRGFDQEGAKKIIDYNMTPVVSSWDHIEHLEAVCNSTVDIHLKFDTGMNRLGFMVSEAEKLRDRLKNHSKIKLKALVTHLFHGEDATSADGDSAKQLRALDQVCEIFKDFKIFVHALNTAGLLCKMSLEKNNQSSKAHPLMLRNWGLRPGLLIYGYNPVSEVIQADFKPVMSLKSQTSVFRHLKAGETVSYGGTWKAEKDSVIAVVPIGYADGYHRILSNQSQALFMGHRVPVVGNVCMDYMMLDVTSVLSGKDTSLIKDAEVVLFGQSTYGSFLSAEELAVKAKSITWEMLTSVGERVPRIYVGSQENFVNNELGGA